MNINYAVVSAFERSKEHKKHHASTRMFTVLLMAVFFIALMAGLAGGAFIFKSVSNTHARNNDVRLQSGLLANVVHSNDALFAVEEGEGPEGRALVLVETLDSGSYETRIYLYRGFVVQEYAVAGSAYSPQTATMLFKSSEFDFSFDGQVLVVTTDQGESDIALRSRQGGSS